jgi:hypothetical protein
VVEPITFVMKTILKLISLAALSFQPAMGAPLADFTLPDVNNTTVTVSGATVNASTRRGQIVKPSDYRNRIVAVYFGKEA